MTSKWRVNLLFLWASFLNISPQYLCSLSKLRRETTILLFLIGNNSPPLAAVLLSLQPNLHFLLQYLVNLTLY